MTRRASFKQDDVARAIRAVTSAGQQWGSVRIAPDGSIEVYAKGAVEAPRLNDWDDAT